MKRIILLYVAIVCVSSMVLSAEVHKITAEWNYHFTCRPNTTKIKFTVVVPKSLKNRQKVYDIRYSVQPSSIFEKDGTTYAEYTFQRPQQQFTITIEADIDLYRNDLSTVKKERKYTENDTGNEYLTSEKFIEADSPEITEAAAEIRGKSREQIVQAIFTKVTEWMTYGGYYADDMGALHACQTGNGDCTEYADYFVALCRAKGIPARTHEGYTVTWGNTPKHVWVEVFFDEYGWVSFDPTFVDTGEGAFDTMSNIYLYLSPQRNDERLNNYHFWMYYYWGGKISVEDQFTVRER